ncbi:MAG: type II toxin-antitoxin system prevent-host-death family antitoxin [Chloroflexi bacterium]|nr:type II toxin-antitoxin system prevent-host-death family antitoxin [Chloroflexota bacterium]MDL1943932.1 type II toxin-antitoxin system Phd/YefM family antitoxin [Chloroflexi bacterium CFX2]
MNKTWQVHEAKNQLSEVIARALKQGPQVITRHGRKTVVVVSYAEYKALQKAQVKFSEFFRSSPLMGLELDVARNKSLPSKRID